VRRALSLAALGALALALAGCSQVAAIAPVGGGRVADVRYAANDLLVEAGIEIRTAPVCREADHVVTCAGTTLDGAPIAVESAAGDEDAMTLTVGGDTLYSGSIQDVLDRAMLGPEGSS
jgi:hypothetical protein